jgi:2-oxoglutarate dehydrogenase E1 component
VIEEVDPIDATKVRRIVFCSGKVYFDLLERRRAEKSPEVALVRIEELYPFPADDYQAVLDRYAKAWEIVWCQEEPQNQGAWYQIRHRLQAPLDEKRTLHYAGRESTAAPATGIYAIHQREQEALVAAALTGKHS